MWPHHASRLLEGAGEQVFSCPLPPLRRIGYSVGRHLGPDGCASDASSEVGVTGEGDGRGCAHYRRGCMLVAPCCDQTFWCRFCHDAAMDVPNAEVVQHKVDRHAVKEVQCGSCGMRQPVGPSCQNEACKNSFGNYFCRICNFFGVCVCVCVCF